jgi:hypothetical protein
MYSILQKSQDNARAQYKKKLHTFVWSFVFALPIFPGRPTYCRIVAGVIDASEQASG